MPRVHFPMSNSAIRLPRLRFMLALLTLILATACVQSSGRYGLYTDTSVIAVNKATAHVGEMVTVTLQGVIGLTEGSELPSTDFRDVLLGACFTTLTDDAGGYRGGFCGGDTVEPLPAWVGGTLLESLHVKSFGTLEVKRGERRVLTLTFSFTANRPLQLEVQPWFYADSRLGDYARGSPEAQVVTFVD